MRSLFRSLALALALAIPLGACALSSAATPTPAAPVVHTPSVAPAASGTATINDLSGKWDGTWQNTSPDTAKGTITISWTQSGTLLSGTISINNSTCISTTHMSGSVSSATITFGVV
jgi:hypothetical protein